MLKLLEKMRTFFISLLIKLFIVLIL